MGQLIDDLLAFSRTGRSEMRLIRTDMRGIVDQVIAELEPEWRGRQVDWDIRPLEPVVGDPHLLRLVWTNLVSNALKYTRPRDRARIEIGQEHGADGSEDGDHDQPDEITYYVRDNGVGFNMEYAHKLFGVFQRLHRADEFEGTGYRAGQRAADRSSPRRTRLGRGEAKQRSVFNFSLPRNRREDGAVLCQI